MTPVLQYMREGGAAMWLILATGVASAVLAALREPAARAGVLAAGCVTVLIEGLLGMATGMEAMAASYPRLAAGGAAVLAQGLGELANNGTLAGAVAAALGGGALLASRAARRGVADLPIATPATQAR